MTQAKTEPIAIIGMGCRFPGGVETPQAFWELLRQGQNTVTEIPASRWPVDDYYDPDPDAPGKMHTRHGSFLDQVDQFDPQFFNISPREAVSLDPQQRLLLEVAWEAVEHANIPPEQLRHSLTGVFIGIGGFEYALHSVSANGLEQIDAYYGTGNTLSVASGRISYTLGLTGPSLSVDTACSSSLVALHLACQSLRHRECNAALAGGINLMIAPTTTIGFSKARMMSPTGRCKTFAADADGYVRGEGCGVVVLKRLSDAVADQDHILAVIRGSAINQEGPSPGLTAPSILAQAAVIRQALANAGVEPAQVGYVETHGTGTPVGDPIEARALGAVFGPDRPPEQPLYVGSVKTNIGHLETASGMAGLIKLILALQHQEIPANLHFQQPSPHIPWADIPLQVVTQHRAWPGQGKKLAGLSGFGFSGTNVHFVLEEAPAPAEPKPDLDNRPLHLLTLSAKTETALIELADRYRNLLAAQPHLAWPEVCFATHTGRGHFRHRLGLAAASTEQAAEKLGNFAQGQHGAGVWAGFVEREESPKIASLFTGQGSQYVGMGRHLYETQPVFRQALAECAKILRDHLPQPLLSVLYPPPEEASPIDETAYTQPALFALEYALAQLWQSWGITPAVVLGHSIGEYVAACVAGLFSLEDGLKLVAARGRLMQNLPANGAMVVVFAGEAQVGAALAPYHRVVSIAAYNSPGQIVISGEKQAIEKVVNALEKDHIKTQRLTVSHAFHSPLMEPMLAEFGQILAGVTFFAPHIDIISNVTGQLAGDEAQTPDYWLRHVRQPVKFQQGLQTLQAQNCPIVIELGPKPVLLGLARQTLPDNNGVWLPSLRQGQNDWQPLLAALATLYTHGAAMDWAGFERDYFDQRPSVTLPTYPFQRQRFWIEPSTATPSPRNYAPDDKNLHPLLGRPVHSAALQPHQFQFEARIGQHAPAFLTDHRIFQTALLPATAYLEMALAAGRIALKTETLTLENVMLEQVLILPEDGLKTIQVLLTPENAKTYIFQIYSLSGNSDNPTWTRHAVGKIAQEKAPADEILVDLESRPQTHHLTEIPAATCFQQSLARGFNFGPGFQLIRRVWQGDNQALGQTQLPDKLAPEANRYLLHPALGDACFQVLEATFTGEDTSDIYLPTGLETLAVRGRPGAQLWSWGQVRPSPPETKEHELKLADLQLCNEHGLVVVEIKGLQLRKVSRDVLRQLLQQEITNWLYKVIWLKKEIETQPGPPLPQQASWLIFAHETGLGRQLAALLAQHHHRPVLVWPGETYGPAEEPDHYYLNPAQPEQFQQLLADSLAGGQPAYHGVVHLWGLTASLNKINVEALPAAQEMGTRSVLHLLQAIVRARWPQPPRLWLVTRGAQPAGPEALPLNMAHAPLWGLGRVIAFEHPELHCTRLDLDPRPDPAEAERLWAMLAQPDIEDQEDQIAFRRGIRYVARLIPYGSRVEAGELTIPVEPFRLTMSDYGLLENLTLAPTKRRPPAADEVEIRVRATGLNFRDVLNALGLLQQFAAELGFNSPEDVPFGGECAGEIVALGENVTDFNIGDEVIAALAIGSLSSHVTTNAAFVIPKPQSLSFAEAATLTTTFLTAAYGLTHLAKIKPGDRVLIHAAAGGVGQAAVQIAQQVGAEIFTTASPGKWEFLRAMGISHVLNSRALDFADDVLRLTQGQGVDIVLNSLNGEFIPKSLATLAPQGRFIEIGKIDIWTTAQMKEARPDVAYHAFDLLEVAQQNPGLIQKLLAEMSRLLQAGQLKPLPHQVFFIENAVDAFRYMAQANHIGKVVITQSKCIAENETPVRPDASYLITGGLGELGLLVAGWLAEQGAQHLILTGRRGLTSAAAQKAVDQLAAAGVDVRVMPADVSDPAAITHLLEEAATTMPPLRGIVHAAGILDDGVLLQQTWPRFEAVMAPKVAGAWNLHTLTQHLPLDFFVCFSSMAGLLGSPGQGNYAAANTFMDALMHHRRRLGLPGLSINWGPWANVGMLADLSAHNQARLTAQGITAFAPAQGKQAMDTLLRQNTPQIGILNINWSKFLAQFSAMPAIPFIETLARNVAITPSPKSLDLRQTLQATPAAERPAVLIDYLCAQLARVLGLSSAEQIEPRQRFFELGLDSLMAIELRNQFENSLGQTLPATVLFDQPTVEALAHYLAQNLELPEDSPPANTKATTVETVFPADPPESDEFGATTAGQIERLSEAEAEALLLKELEKLSF
ncbi:MAG: SDR family NAD(P)-dependent oxidoreductase [Anaerolineae bacterium]|nr:SDR family NAD(P)-dependent oxidoreductase [Anaerolineae bacterium]